jgi:hypothetical protein
MMQIPFGSGSILVSIRTQQKPFAMIREFHLADWFTRGNVVCGTAALFSMMTYVQTGSVRHIYLAGALSFERHSLSFVHVLRLGRVT